MPGERRILLLITDLEIGGTPTVVRELATRLHDPGKGVHVEVACLSKWGPVADPIRAAGVTVTALNATRSWQLPSVVRSLCRLVREHRIDTVFSFLVHANAVAAAAKPFCRGVRFLQSIQTTQPRPAWHWTLQRFVQRAAERVVVPSPSAARVAAERANVPADKIVVIPNALDPAAFARSPVPDLDPRPYPVGFIGRLDPIKRVHRLVQEVHALDHVMRHDSGGYDGRGTIHLHVFGDGPERGPIRSEVERLNIAHLVTMHGAVAGPQEALRQVGVLVLRSAAEGFGLVLIEAMAAGVPVVATDVHGIRDVVRDGQTGLLAPDNDRPHLLFTILRVIQEPDLRRRLIENGLREVREKYSWEVVLPQYRALLGIPTR